jgi:hypothetical protein
MARIICVNLFVVILVLKKMRIALLNQHQFYFSRLKLKYYTSIFRVYKE